MDSITKILSNIIYAMTRVYGWLLAALAYFAPIHGVLLLTLMIVTADFVFGLWASNEQHVPRTSRRLRKSVEKTLCYFGVIWLFWEIEKAVGIDEWVCTYKMIAGFIALVEVISILENMAVITGQPVFLRIIKFIRGRASAKDDVIKEIINEKNDEHR